MNEKKIYRYSDMMSMPRGIEMKGYYHGDGRETVTFERLDKKEARTGLEVQGGEE